MESAGNRLGVLAQLSQAISSSLDLDDVLLRIARAAADLLNAPIVEFWMPEPRTDFLTLRVSSAPQIVSGKSVTRLRAGEGGVGWVAEHRRNLNIPDIASDVRIRAVDWFEKRGLTSGLWVPILLEDELVGVLTILGCRPFLLDADEQALLKSVVAQGAAALRNATLFRESERRRQEAEALAETGRILSQALDPHEVGRRITDRICRALAGSSASLFRYDPLTATLVTLAVSGTAGPFSEGIAFPLDVGVVGLAVRERKIIVTNDVLRDPRVRVPDEMRAELATAGHRAVMSLPLIAHDVVIGGLSIRDDVVGREFAARLAHDCRQLPFSH